MWGDREDAGLASLKRKENEVLDVQNILELETVGAPPPPPPPATSAGSSEIIREDPTSEIRGAGATAESTKEGTAGPYSIADRIRFNDVLKQYTWDNVLDTSSWDNSDARKAMAESMAHAIVEDVLEVLNMYMELRRTDDVSRKIALLVEPIAILIFRRPKRPYVRNTLVKSLTQAKPVTGYSGKYMSLGSDVAVTSASSTKDAGAAGRAGAKAFVSGQPDASINSLLNNNVGEVHSDGREIFEQPEVNFARLERYAKEVDFYKTMSHSQIGAWAVKALPTYRFLDALAGALDQRDISQYIRYDIVREVYQLWASKTNILYADGGISEQTMVDLKAAALKDTDEVDRFVDDNEQLLSDYIRQDQNSPQTTFDIIANGIAINAKNLAWSMLEGYLREVKTYNPGCPGFSKYSKYTDRDSGLPDFRLIVLPVPLNTLVHAITEFAALTAYFVNKSKRMGAERQLTGNNLRDVEAQMHDYYELFLKSRLRAMGFSLRG